MGWQVWVSRPVGDSQCSPQGMQVGPYSPAACPYRIHAVRVLVGAAEEKGRLSVHETHPGVCGFEELGARTPSSRGATMGAGGWVLPELASGYMSWHAWERDTGQVSVPLGTLRPTSGAENISLRMIFLLGLYSTSQLLSAVPTERQWVLGHCGSWALLTPIPIVPPSLQVQPNHKPAQLKSCPQPAQGS